MVLQPLIKDRKKVPNLIYLYGIFSDNVKNDLIDLKLGMDIRNYIFVYHKPVSHKK